MVSYPSLRVIVPGGLNTDLVGLGVERLLGPGELTLGGAFTVGPGGKARNMAQMIAAYLGRNTVAMLGRTAQDPFGLWRPPLDALARFGVDTSGVRRLTWQQARGKFPGIALIPVDKNGKNQIYVLPGVNADFCPADIDRVKKLFLAPRVSVMALALEIPLATVRHCLTKAARNNIRVVLDPGGISGPIHALLNDKLFLLKPNEHEARLITGVRIDGFTGAQRAARAIMRKGVRNVLITHGAKGAYLFTPDTAQHLPVPLVKKSAVRDETGCGDQVTAVLAGALAEGRSVEEAARLAVKAGSMQFYRAGIKPVTRKELSGH